MKTMISTVTLAVLSVVVVPHANAGHERGGQSKCDQLAKTLVRQTQILVHDIEYYFPRARGLNHRAYIIYRLAESTRQDVLLRRDLQGTIRQAAKLEDLLDDLEDDLDERCDDQKNRHIIRTAKHAEYTAKLLRKTLRLEDRHVHRPPPPRRRYGHFGPPPGKHLGYRHSSRPGYITFSKGGFSIGFRLR